MHHSNPASAERRLKILLVEDHDDTRKITAELIQARGFDVVPAATAAAARQAAKEERIDFVIADIGLPDGDGYTLMSELAEGRGLNGIALTARGQQSDKIKAANSGFLQHFTKPISKTTLDSMLEIIRYVFRRT